MEDATKQCPYCGETILATAIKCKYCGEWLAEKSSVTPTPPPPRPSPPPPPPPRLATPTDLPQAQPEAEVEPDALADIEAYESYVKSKNMKALLIVEVIVVLVIHFFTSSGSLWATPVTAIAFILLTTQLGWKRIPLCIGITLLWGYVFWKLELGWFVVVLYSILLLVANWQIVKRIEDDEFTE